jgi:restriction endonuclease Mrr
MTFTDAAVEVLRQLGKPLHYKEITDFAIERNLLSVVGKSPDVTMGARLAALMKKETPDCPLVRVKQGVYALREWDEKTIRGEGKKGKKGKAEDASRPDEAAAEVLDEVVVDDASAEESGLEDVAAEDVLRAVDDDGDDEILIPVAKPAAEPSQTRAAAPRAVPARADEDDEPLVDAPEERFRREILASAADMFEEEDDDDQPILGGGEARPAEGADGEGRRRRRRRRRGRGAAEGGAPAGGGGGLPSYTATPVDAAPLAREAPPRDGGRDRDRDRDGGRDRDRDRDGGRDRDRFEPQAPRVDHLAEGAPPVDDLGGRDFADAIQQILQSFDRNLGPVSLRQITEAAQRRNKVLGDTQQVQSMVAAAVRADNARRIATGARPRFRFSGGRVGLTDWSLTNDLLAAEAEAIAAVERYRDAARKAFARKVAELPGHAFVELCMLVLERGGASQIRAIRRAGTPGFEGHFSAVLKTPAEDVRLAIVIRKDGREVGRERVTDLRGALHHYASGGATTTGPATMGWIFTSGSILSGAREEASLPNASPVSLTDGAGLAKLCEELEIAVVKARLPIALPDLDLLEALRAS